MDIHNLPPPLPQAHLQFPRPPAPCDLHTTTSLAYFPGNVCTTVTSRTDYPHWSSEVLKFDCLYLSDIMLLESQGTVIKRC